MNEIFFKSIPVEYKKILKLIIFQFLIFLPFSFLSLFFETIFMFDNGNMTFLNIIFFSFIGLLFLELFFIFKMLFLSIKLLGRFIQYIKNGKRYDVGVISLILFIVYFSFNPTFLNVLHTLYYLFLAYPILLYIDICNNYSLYRIKYKTDFHKTSFDKEFSYHS